MSGPGPKVRPPSARFWAKVRQVPSGCWEWTASTDGRGYGQFYVSPGRMVRAHRFAFEEMVGPIPEGLQLDHLCRNTICVNAVDHLEPVTARVNLERADNVWDRRLEQTHCKEGHPLTGPNVRVYRGRERTCLTCKRDRDREWMRARRAAS